MHPRAIDDAHARIAAELQSQPTACDLSRQIFGFLMAAAWLKAVAGVPAEASLGNYRTKQLGQNV